MLVIPALGRLRQEDNKFEPRLGYISEFQISQDYIFRPCHQKKQNKTNGNQMI
jgi:hypothetical protein